ncbi:MAG: hypothetical protein WC846_04110 [Candidatus Gracilibacteria bacterium]
MTSFFKISLIFILLGTFSVVFLVRSILLISVENQELQAFLDKASMVQVDFEQSLSMYTEETKSDLALIDALRPQGEVDYIGFISKIENIGQMLDIAVTLKTIDVKSVSSVSGQNVDITGSNYIDYAVEFYSNNNQLLSFLYSIEALPYFVRVQNVQYKNLEFAKGEDTARPNVSLTIRLYVK